ncbi:MAG: CHASE3 domain-containing protein, partial [Bacteroidia bacterium]|nr:CHASE3 domain-containing protein [Bacteroidia bacterium]
MSTQRSLQYRIIPVMLTVVALVTVTGIFAYQRFTATVSSIEKESQPNVTIDNLQDLQTYIREAENCVKSYSLTRDEFYLNDFYWNAKRVSKKIDELHAIQKELSIKSMDLDSLDRLINRKFEGLNSVLQLQDQYR